MRTFERTVCILLLGMTIGAGAWANGSLRLPGLISDHMVLQRGKPIQLYGWAEPGAGIRIRLADHKGIVRTGEDGRWFARMPVMNEGGPYKLTIRGGGGRFTIRDVLIGDVWVASGQSNMQWSVEQSANAEETIENAHNEWIRLFSVPRTVSGEPEDDVDAEWQRVSPETVAEFSAVGYYFAREIHERADVPVGIVHASWGGTPAESWTHMSSLLEHEDLRPIVEQWEADQRDFPGRQEQFERELAAWEEERDAAANAGEDPPPRPRPPRGPNHPWRPSGLWNAMIAPLTEYGIRGVIWYQGESNAARAYQYRKLFPVMINDWRIAWEDGNLPFYFVQLANFRERRTGPHDSEWAELREAQLMTLALPATGMAVTIDIGEADDIHPKNKQDVGKRLALVAMANTYDNEVVYSGPFYREMTVDANVVRLSFDHVADGLRSHGEKLSGFEIAGSDQVFRNANAAIDGDQVMVWSEDVPAPVAVRYAWADNPDANLCNTAGLPASPFRTDDWPGATYDAR